MRCLRSAPVAAAIVGAASIAAFVLPAASVRAAGVQAPGDPSGGEPAAGTLQDVRAKIDSGDYAGAEEMARRLLATAEQTAGPDAIETAAVIDRLVEARVRGGKSAEPETLALAERAVGIKETALGPGHPDLALSLRGLGRLRGDRGDYGAARPLYERALAIQEAALGPDDPETARTLNYLGILLQNVGDYDQSRRLLERVLAIREATLPPDHPDLAIVLHSLANVHHATGEYVEARALIERAIAIWEESGTEDPRYATSLEGAAVLMTEMGDHVAARPLLERALALSERRLGPGHPNVGNELSNLAAVSVLLGDGDGALRYAERSLQIFERTYGPDHFLVAESLVNRGDAQMFLARPDLARPDYERALRIREKVFGPDHPLVAQSLMSLARALPPGGDAFRMALRAEGIARRQFQQTARGLSEREALRFGETRANGLDLAVSVLVGGGHDALPSDAARRVLDHVVRSRALVLDEMATRHQAIATGNVGRMAPLVAGLDQARARVIRLLTDDSAVDDAAPYRERLTQARKETEIAERTLAEKSLVFRRDLNRRRVGLGEVSAALPPGSALVSYVRYRRSAGPSPGDHAVRSYAALILPAGGPPPVAVALGPAEAIDAGVLAWRSLLATFPAGLGGDGAFDAEARTRDAGERLRRLIWDPIARRLGGAERVFVVPDGSLDLINFAALPAGRSRYLIESGPLLHYLSAERDLVAARKRPARGGGLLALGGPDYGAPADDDDRPRAAPVYRSAGPPCGDFGARGFAPLPGARLEAEALASLWLERAAQGRGPAPLVLTGSGASEAAFKERARGQRVVHLATHAFFLDPNCAETPAGGVDPLLLSGLALAGADLRGAAAEVPALEDGILTSEEIASLDLSSAEWAVLSACDTGIGRVQDGEGVLGLRRAFQLAGAGTVIMSLWEVEDAATMDWMKELYRARLAGASTAQAMRRASLAILDRRRADGRTTHPFYWGAFVAAGAWR